MLYWGSWNSLSMRMEIVKEVNIKEKRWLVTFTITFAIGLLIWLSSGYGSLVVSSTFFTKVVFAFFSFWEVNRLHGHIMIPLYLNSYFLFIICQVTWSLQWESLGSIDTSSWTHIISYQWWWLCVIWPWFGKVIIHNLQFIFLNLVRNVYVVFEVLKRS